MVHTILGPMEWGILSCSPDGELECFYRWGGGELPPPIVSKSGGTKQLQFGLGLKKRVTSEDYVEAAYYSPYGFERAEIPIERKHPFDTTELRLADELELKAPVAFRYAIERLGEELYCRSWYVLSDLQIGICLENFWSARFNKEAFLIWLGNRLDFYMTEYDTRL